jgi:RsiW-degrading membrane proteinase PrsW (M82 family)
MLVLPGGLLLLSGGAGCAILYLLLPFLDGGPDLLATNLTVASVAAIGLTLGFALLYQARRFLAGHPSATFYPPSPRRLILLFFLCLFAGQLMVSLLPSARVTALVFPLLHILAAATPALAILAFVGRRTTAASWRTVVLELSHGAVLAPMAALAAELAVVLAVVVAICLIVALTPGGVERLVELSVNLQDPTWLENTDNVARLVLSPAVLSAITLVFVVVAPLIEELLKGLGVPLLGYRLRGQAEALLWGVACGAGFAIGESLFNGSIALEGWGAVMLMRCGASLMHCTASGVMGLGWQQALVRKRPWRLLAAYVASAGVHALWNAAAVGVAVPSLWVMSNPDDLWRQGFGGLAMLGSLALLVLLTLSMGIAMVHLTNRARQASSKEQLAVKEEAPGAEAPQVPGTVPGVWPQQTTIDDQGGADEVLGD